MKLSMSKAQREAFLADTHVAIVSIPEEGRGPLTVPIWYSYARGGDVLLVMGGSSRKAELIRAARRLSLCVQSEAPPYQYVSIEGPATIEGPPDFEGVVKPMAYRYLGKQMGAAYLELTRAEREGSVIVRMRPERWITVDYNKMAAQAGA
jgi:nitroimidazol reductase NimA-like FMN-containing flavoprotein (pyridoxamine 5'-phosphate oxidase superfamily)